MEWAYERRTLSERSFQIELLNRILFGFGSHGTFELRLGYVAQSQGVINIDATRLGPCREGVGMLGKVWISA